MHLKWSSLKKNWKSYRFRFVPWLAYNFKKRSVKINIRDEKDVVDKDIIINRLKRLLQSFHDSKMHEYVCDVDWTEQHEINNKILFNQFGFSLVRRKSDVDEDGIGVFVNRGVVQKGDLVALYPGTVYHPTEPLFFQSLCNPFIFKCVDGIYIDGNNCCFSKYIYKSCVHRDRVWPHFTADCSWLTGNPVNPLAIGQYVNNHSKERSNNVVYQEYNLPINFPFHLRSYIPNICFSVPHPQVKLTWYMRIIGLLAVRDITVDEEILSSYFTVVHKS